MPPPARRPTSRARTGSDREEELSRDALGVPRHDLGRRSVAPDADHAVERTDGCGRERGDATNPARRDSRLDFVRRAVGDDRARPHHQDTIGERVRLLEVVGRQDDGPAGGGEALNLLPESAAGLDVEADRRLIEKQQVRVSADGEGKLQALPLPARQVPVLAIGPPRSGRRRQAPRRRTSVSGSSCRTNGYVP